MTERVKYQTETADMMIPHGLLRSFFASASALIAAVPDGDRQRSGLAGSYVDNVLKFLDVHHGSEDELLWPVLASRCPQAAELLARMEAQHHAVDRLRHEVESSLGRWTASAESQEGERLAAGLRKLDFELETHLGEEEQEILPLASENVSPEEWGALPGHAMANFNGDKPWLVLGLVMEQMNDEQRVHLIAALPPPALEMWQARGETEFTAYIADLRSGAPDGDPASN
ncbi:MAG: hemerythrin domain-containing protein [Candidatus Dormibacteria bacterium]